MDQEQFGKLIKKLRMEHHLTQKQFAEKYHVSFQAVSKWETGKNMPDTALIAKICKDFNISLDELLQNNQHPQTKKQKLSYTIIAFLALVSFIFIMVNSLTKKPDDFQFKTLTSDCDIFNLSGIISYNQSKTAIHISNIQYCGGEDREDYKEIECTLYESDGSVEKKIDSHTYKQDTTIKLEDFLRDCTFTVDHYEKTCDEYKKGSLYLSIQAKNIHDQIISYKIPLNLNECPK